MAADNYLEVGPFTLWFDQRDGTSIHLTTATDDPRLVDEEGKRPGLRVVFSSNPRSADYNPGNFNRCARALAAAGKPAPAEVPLHPRHLSKRTQVTAALAVEKTGASTTQVAADPAQFGWVACPHCRAIVVDFSAHSTACLTGK